MYGVVVGDALGSLTETLSQKEIFELYGWLDDFVDFRFKPYGQTRRTGAWTDDSSLIVYMSRAIIANRGATVAGFVQAFLDWSDDPSVVQYSGPTTRRALSRLRAGEDPGTVGRGSVESFTGTSNGGAMKAAPAGWLNPGDVDAAARTAAMICLPSHNTNVAIAGAAAIAAGCAVASAGCTVDEIVAAAIEGATIGEGLGLEQGREVAGPSVARRIASATEVATNASTFKDAVRDIGEVVGSGLATAESVPAAIALVVAARGDVNLTAVGAANVGDDTDTVGTMAAAISGTFSGRAAANEEWYRLVSTVNDIDLATLSAEFAAVVEGR
ncbi:ADP-ribosylglycohydrolase family protein [Amycolatopsis sp. GM8]|uniref:ADP-ribosylglycohydrolase family protein n=1 Tax=Amycolatopsis sp. GM8 TaxID=2896530 RepID=UPI001F1CED63|nr:ADP-ribosylglycohydrolase family protein [Amycolatopsis sp. GM8]